MDLSRDVKIAIGSLIRMYRISMEEAVILVRSAQTLEKQLFYAFKAHTSMFHDFRIIAYPYIVGRRHDQSGC